MTRNLIYHFYPEKTKFDFHYNYLMEYLSIFNGRKIICFSLAKSDDIYNLNEIEHLFKDFEIFTVDNDIEARESKSFFQVLLPEIINEPGITFFGHSKSNSPKRLNASNADIHTLWTSYMYTSNLSNIDLVEEKLNTYTAVGPFVRTRQFPNNCIPCCKWHFSGTMFWFNNQSLRDLSNSIESYKKSYQNNRYAVEGFFGSIMGIEQGCCIFDVSAKNVNTSSYVPDDLLNYLYNNKI